jgi:hypothetical protein
MQRKLAPIMLAFLLTLGLGVSPARAGVESLLGKWQVKAETPSGPLDLEFEFRQEGGQILGTASTIQGSVPLSAIKFEEPKLAMDLIIGDSTYKLFSTLKDGKLEGAWAQVGGEMKGTWTAARSAAATPVPAPSAGGIVGAWSTVAVTPNGDMAATLELKQEAEKLMGVISSDMGSLPIQAASFKDNKLQFDLELGGNTYRILATLDGDKLNGGWAPAAGGEGGAWRATRKASSAPSAPAAPAPSGIAGSWNVVAVTPDGNMQFVAEIKQAGNDLSGTVVTPDGRITMQKLVITDNKVTFEVEYMGGTYRVEATLTNEKLSGKWSAVGGGEGGALTGERKKS